MTGYFALVADNTTGHLNDVIDELITIGFTVFIRATNPADAKQDLRDNYVHLALIDLRLNDESEGDRSGSAVVRDVSFPFIRIIYSNYDTNTEREKLLRSLSLGNIHNGAVDIVSKRDLTSENIERRLTYVIKEMIRNNLRINEQAIIKNDEGNNFSGRDIFQMIYYSLPSPEHYERHYRQLDDILRMTFYDKDYDLYHQPIQQLTVKKLNVIGLICWLVVESYHEKLGQKVYLVGVGHKKNMKDDYNRVTTISAFEQDFSDYIFFETLDYQSNRYYRFSRHTTFDLIKPLDELLNQNNLRSILIWMQSLDLDFQPRTIKVQVTNNTLFSPDDLLKSQSSIKNAISLLDRGIKYNILHFREELGWIHNEIFFAFANFSYVLDNPTDALKQVLTISLPHSYRIVHGNILERCIVDQRNNTVSIYDFSQSHKNHTLFDIVSLFNGLFLNLIVQPSDYLQVLQAILSNKMLDNPYYEIANGLKEKAKDLWEKDMKDASDIFETFFGYALLIDALKTLQQIDLQIVVPRLKILQKTAFLLTTISTLTAFLSGKTNFYSKTALTSIYLTKDKDDDKKGTLWVKGRNKGSLSGNDYIILRTLIKNLGEVVSYENLSQAKAESMKDQVINYERESIQQDIQRLRRRLEGMLEDESVEIETEASVGYKLIMSLI